MDHENQDQDVAAVQSVDDVHEPSNPSHRQESVGRPVSPRAPQQQGSGKQTHQEAAAGDEEEKRLEGHGPFYPGLILKS